ncbi:hypothetical protein XSR1_50071 [Xenorhabdus szentirmaii DSM 16338]|uniref:Uncharacterized protein n=1 Tax=Xenorhabdus szentirmaii DSM 16338 TaxID=1427518 RepID=W1J1S5_9GAMM|nr:hypothetical protein XSR1_50071 [Xenorhabdus szentirmaii DSM 16338]
MGQVRAPEHNGKTPYIIGGAVWLFSTVLLSWKTLPKTTGQVA